MGWLEAILYPYYVSLGFSTLSGFVLFVILIVLIFKD